MQLQGASTINVDPAKWINEAVSNTSSEWLAKALWTNQPNLRRATEKLALYITPWLPDNQGRAILPKAVCLAVQKSDQAIQIGDGGHLGRLTAVYLDALTSVAKDVARIDVTGIDDEFNLRRWGYFSEPLLTWAAHMKLTDLMAHTVATEPVEAVLLGVRTHMIASLTEPVDAGYLAKYAPLG